MEYQIWVNGKFVDRDKAQVSILDRGFRVGDVVFDTSRTFNGKVFKLREHLERFYSSLKYVRIDPQMSIEEMEKITLDVVRHNEKTRTTLNDDYMISQIVSGGIGARGGQPTIAIIIDPLGSPKWAPALSNSSMVMWFIYPLFPSFIFLRTGIVSVHRVVHISYVQLPGSRGLAFRPVLTETGNPG